MTRRLPALLALLALAAVPLSLPHAAASAEDGAEAFTVSDAVFRWGINDESNNNAFAPGTYNFPGAGKAPDPGRGGQVLDGRARWPSTGALAWRASDGKVRIEKVTSSGPVLATYAGLRTGPDGQPLGGPTVEVFSGHQVVIAGGTGTVDPAAGTATIRWKGSFTVFYYSGMTFFSVTDPVLEVTPTSARITATGSGHASSMEDMTKWSPIPATTVTLAELDGVDAEDLRAEKGFTAPTRYLGVRYDAPASGTPQVRTGPAWGAVPAGLLAFLEKIGMASYWYSSGGSGDRFKVTKPVSISWDARTALEPGKPPPTPATPAPQPTNPAGAEPPPASQPTAPPTRAAPSTPVQPAAPALPVQQPLDAAAPAAAGPPASYQPPVAYALASSTAPGRPDPADRWWEWALGFLLLLGAVGITLLHPVMNRLKGTR